MDYTPEHIIIPEEKLDKISSISQEIIKRTHAYLLRDFNSNEIQTKNRDTFKRQPEIIHFKTEPEYPADLEDNLDNLAYVYKEKQDPRETIDIIEYILKKYKYLLVRWDYIDLILKKCFALYYLWKYDTASNEIQKISPYKNFFMENQNDDFYALQWNILFTIWERDQNKYLLQKSLEYFDYIIAWANETHQLDLEFYRDIQYRRALIKTSLSQDKDAIDLLKEIISISPEYSDNIRINSFYLLWSIFSTLSKNKEAIDSYREYLKYRPDDQDIKNYIRILSERDPE